MGNRQTVIICEDRAHWPSGHWGVRFAELAEGFISAGHDVHVLVSSEWVYEKEFSIPKGSVHRYGAISRTLTRIAQVDTQMWGWQKVRYVLRHLALTHAALRTLKKLRAKDALIVSVCFGLDPYLLSIFGGKYIWIVHAFESTPRRFPLYLLKMSQLSLYLRARMGKIFLVALPDTSFRFNWSLLRPELNSEILRLAGATQHFPLSNARNVLGISDFKKVALLFGAFHNEKMPRSVIEAMRQLPEWTLFVVGGIADKYLADNSHSEFPPNVVFKGGAISQMNRRYWHLAADVSVLSFKSGYRRNSGTLMDALSAGRPVVVSNDSFAADLTKKYSLGEVFEPGDVQGVVDALKRVRPLQAEIIEAAMADLSNRALADQHMKFVSNFRDSFALSRSLID